MLWIPTKLHWAYQFSQGINFPKWWWVARLTVKRLIKQTRRSWNLGLAELDKKSKMGGRREKANIAYIIKKDHLPFKAVFN